MNHEDMTYTEAKDILENYIHTEFFDRKDSDFGQAMVKAIILLEKESKLEEKYSGEFLHCPVCDCDQIDNKNTSNEYGNINIKECPQCGFSVMILKTKGRHGSNITNVMSQICWGKVYDLYKKGAKNGGFIIPWQTFYANSIKIENLYVKYGFDTDNMLKWWDI